MYICAVTNAYPCNECIFYYKFFLIVFLKPFFYLDVAKPIRYCIELAVSNAITNFRSFPYLDFELSLPPVRKTGDFAILSNRRFIIRQLSK